MNDEKQLAVKDPTPASILQAAVQGGITEQNIAVVERMMALMERQQEKQAERDFAEAFVRLQQSIAETRIEATKGVPDKSGREKFRFAPYEEIMAKVQPLLNACGFSVTFEQKIEECRIVSICTLMHIGGHSRSNSFAARIGSGPPGASESQADGAASTYAKRYALCNALNIVIEREALDADARAVGSSMLPSTRKELQDRLRAVKGDESAFLKYAGSANWESIPAEAYEKLDHQLFRSEVKCKLRDAEGNWIKF